MQSDRDALLAGILADPDADLPRLVFADWLEETGHPANCARAEYIRLAIELWHRPDGRGGEDAHRLDALKGAFRDEWDVFEATLVKGNLIKPPRRDRGFVSTVSLAGRALPAALREWSRRHPVQSLFVSGPFGPRLPPPEPTIFLALDRLIFHRATEFGDFADHYLLDARLPQLRTLTMNSCGLTDGDIVRLVRVLARNPTLTRLENLDLTGNPLTDHAAHALAAADWPGTLHRLSIGLSQISNAGLEVLFRRFGFEELRPRLALS